MQLKRVLLLHQQLHEFGVNEQLLPAHLLLSEHADVDQFIQIDRGSLAYGDILFDQIVDTAIRLLKQGVDEFTAVNAGWLVAHMRGGVVGQGANGRDFGGGPAGGFFLAAQYIEQPFCPVLLSGNPVQQPVIVSLVLDDVHANRWRSVSSRLVECLDAFFEVEADAGLVRQVAFHLHRGAFSGHASNVYGFCGSFCG
ncbi:MAG: hypothetical protein IV085_09100, partial [Thiobacillus sp.]|nr:hypothetical protein [Thiobacillus sp.]